MTDFRKMYDGSWFTIEGAGGDLNEWKEGLQQMLDERGAGTIQEWATWKGSEMNEWGHLTGDNAYPDDLTFLAFSLDGLEVGKLVPLKFMVGGRWFDDIVDNNARREGYHPMGGSHYE